MSLFMNDWTQILAGAPWTGRRLHRCVSDGLSIFMTGGIRGATVYADVWRSTDGVSWTELTPDGEYIARKGHGFIRFLGKYWLMGGSTTGGGFLNDVWSSTNLITWTQETASASWAARHEFTLFEHDSKLWIVGGYDGSYYNDAWSSTDGINWSLESSAVTRWTATGIREHVSTSFEGKLWAIGGDFTSFTNDVNSSLDGATWSLDATAEWSARREHQILNDTINSLLYIVGGYDGNYKNDVWESIDGVTWNEIAQLNAFTARSDFALVLHAGVPYIIGGYDGSDLGDVWSIDYSLSCDFSGDSVDGSLYHFVQFTSSITGAYSTILWDFGDGNTSTDVNPLHKYERAGVYTVSLTVSNDVTSSVETKVDYVTVESVGFTGSPVSGRSPLEVRFTPWV